MLRLDERIAVWCWEAHSFEFTSFSFNFLNSPIVRRFRRSRRYILLLFPFSIALVLLFNTYSTLMYSLDGSSWHITFITPVVHCSVCVAWLNRLACGSGWLRSHDPRLVRWCSWFRLKFCSTTAQVLINYFASSAHVPASHLLLIYSFTTTRNPVLLVCWTDFFAGYT